MNIFRLVGDGCHILAVFLMLYQLEYVKDATDISILSQELLLITFVLRYLDIGTHFYSLYNTLVKMFYLWSAVAICAQFKLARGNIRDTMVENERIQKSFILIVAFIINIAALPYSFAFGFQGFMWGWSIVLEPAALIPQFVILYENRLRVPPFVKAYIFLMWIYRVFYIMNWIYRSHYEPYYRPNYFVYFFGALHALTLPLAVLLNRYKPYEERNSSEDERGTLTLLDLEQDSYELLNDAED
ncbi:hypothetical protein CTEN210_11101 [Chaetoceros tenuissimus]|uniref:ER lumen protein-retaining receptor n=1 Tax=Chaetoceros tenuissimus TaxID=426638 RepID=A0AAD3D166_9STRA|nr:hypothetical protein CTEN210_11101 [Chaetoceros tenuissimus]